MVIQVNVKWLLKQLYVIYNCALLGRRGLSQHLIIMLLQLHQDLVPGNHRYQPGRGRCVLERLERLRVYLRCLAEQGFPCAVHVVQL